MNNEILETEWFKSIPKFDCPTCNKGLFAYHKKDLIKMEDGISKQSRLFEYEPRYYSGKFILTSNCTNPECEETCAVLGSTSLRSKGWHSGGYDPEIDFDIPPHEMFETFFKIQFIQPVIQLFSIPKKISNNLRNKLEESFGLFWLDKSACGNKIRTSVEILLNDLKIRKTEIKSGKRNKLSLHQRIKFYQTKNPSLASNLLAIKWIGNSSSHGVDNVTVTQIVEAYKILEYVLIKIYENKDLEIKRLTKKINKRKK